MDNLNQDLTSLLRRAGLDNSGGEWGSRILLVAGIVLICYLAVKLFRHLVTPALQRISAQTRTMWDDHLFDDKVLHAACRLIPPVLLYLLLPLAFGDDPSLLKLLHKGCSIYLIVVTIALHKHLSQRALRHFEQTRNAARPAVERHLPDAQTRDRQRRHRIDHRDSHRPERHEHSGRTGCIGRRAECLDFKDSMTGTRRRRSTLSQRHAETGRLDNDE